MFSSVLCSEHLQLFPPVWFTAESRITSLDDSLVQISDIIANFPLHFLLSEHRACVKAMVLQSHGAHSPILAEAADPLPPGPGRAPGPAEEAGGGETDSGSCFSQGCEMWQIAGL